MIPVSFDYVKASSVQDAVAALGQGGEDAKVLSGGQSLIPVLRLRLSAPTVLIDVSQVDEMRGVSQDGDRLVIGAATTHHDVMTDALVRQHAPLLAQAVGTVADPAVRHRGTFGGALSHADPAGDLGAVALALECELVIYRAFGCAHGRREGLLRRLPGDRPRAGRDPHPGAGPGARGGLGLPLREVQPGRAGLVDRRGGRGRAALERLDRRGPDRADQHGDDAAAGRSGRGRARRGRRFDGGHHGPAPHRPPRAPARRATSTGRRTTASTWPAC